MPTIDSKSQRVGEEWAVFHHLPLRKRKELILNHETGQFLLVTHHNLPKPLDPAPVVFSPVRTVIEGRCPLRRVVEGLETVDGRDLVFTEFPPT